MELPTHFLQPVVLFLKPVVSHRHPPAYKIKHSLWLGLPSSFASPPIPVPSLHPIHQSVIGFPNMPQALRLFLCMFSPTCPCPHASISKCHFSRRNIFPASPDTQLHSPFFKPFYWYTQLSLRLCHFYLLQPP